MKKLFIAPLILCVLISCGGGENRELKALNDETGGNLEGYLKIKSSVSPIEFDDYNNPKLSIEIEAIKICKSCDLEEVSLQFFNDQKNLITEESLKLSFGEMEKVRSILENGKGSAKVLFSEGLILDEDRELISNDAIYYSISAKAGHIPTAAELLIGTAKEGGIIFSSDDKGTHGLVISSKDLGTELDWNEAKAICESYSAGGKDDWRLPTNEEFKLIYKNLILSNVKLESTYYWTSTVYNHNFGTTWPYSFDMLRGESDHNQGMVNKFHVRAVRNF
ncbi:MAG: hypothetical protein RI922_1762 [Bacteroidota bacterium]|jgi:hypothetical protein